VDYTLGGSTLFWTLAQQQMDGTIRTFTGVSPIMRVDVNTITIPAFALSDSLTSLSLLTRKATLRRNGQTFRGIVQLVDGGLETSWPDYTTYLVELVDSNDTNFDGLPDIVFAPEPDALFMSTMALCTLVAVRRLRLTRASKESQGIACRLSGDDASVPTMPPGSARFHV